MVNYMGILAETYKRTYQGGMAMAYKDVYLGTGTTLSSNYYLRNFYQSNRNARTASKRHEMSNTELTLADSHALRKALKKLGSSEFNEDHDTSIRNSVSAYIQTYNNMLSSASTSSDRTLERNAKQLKSITNEYAKELDKIGITVNDDGTLTSRETLLNSADLSKFKKLFSGDSEYMQRTTAYAKRLVRRSEALDVTATQKQLKEIADRKADSSTTTADTVSDIAAAALAASDSPDLNTLLNNGIGKNVNVVL